LGLNAYHGDVSAGLIRDGQVAAALEEERFRRVKHWAGFPAASLTNALSLAGVEPQEVGDFAVSRNPRAHRLRKVAFGLRHRPGFRLIWDRGANWQRIARLSDTIAECLSLPAEHVRQRLHFVEHHPAHLASTFFVSPCEDAAVCAIDGFGDFVSTSIAVGHGRRLDVQARVYFPHSLGMLYLALTQYLGFLRYGDEYKVMGLAPYGEPRYVDELRRLVRLRPDGGFRLDLAYFNHHRCGGSMTWDDGEPTMAPVFTSELEKLLGPARHPDDPVEARHEDIAASLQAVFEDAAFHVLNSLYERTRNPRLCLAGGCAMNSVMNGKIRQRTPFEEVYIQPAAADNGTALGAALWVWHQVLGQPRSFVMDHAYWGPEFDETDIAAAIARVEGDLRRCRVRRVEEQGRLCRWTAERIAEGKVVGWFQGRMEWGARALGNRSILADPRRADMRDIINSKIKFRERFRPFAPSILEEALDEYFVDAVPDPFMIQVYPIRPEKRDVIPAVTHVDGSGRLQTVSRRTNPLYWRLIKAFEGITGVPVLLNTSFNENEPIVQQPSEALDCFLRTRMDILVLGPYVVQKPSVRPEAANERRDESLIA
jgi:carbamoyltransferase